MDNINLDHININKITGKFSTRTNYENWFWVVTVTCNNNGYIGNIYYILPIKYLIKNSPLYSFRLFNVPLGVWGGRGIGGIPENIIDLPEVIAAHYTYKVNVLFKRESTEVWHDSIKLIKDDIIRFNKTLDNYETNLKIIISIDDKYIINVE